MKFLTFLLITFTLSFANTVSIDYNASKVNFKVSNMWLNHVSGTFKSFDADINYDTTNHLIRSLKATINAQSIFTDMDSRDDSLRGKDYLKADYFPQIRFEMYEIFNNHIVGYLTILDNKKPISILIKELSFKGNDMTLLLEGELDRNEYGISTSSYFLIGKMVKFTITIKGTLDAKTPTVEATASPSS